jgi:hypothetical protein
LPNVLKGGWFISGIYEIVWRQQLLCPSRMIDCTTWSMAFLSWSVILNKLTDERLISDIPTNALARGPFLISTSQLLRHSILDSVMLLVLVWTCWCVTMEQSLNSPLGPISTKSMEPESLSNSNLSIYLTFFRNCNVISSRSLSYLGIVKLSW